jgi:serine/threonine protein phosphatase PrpC
VTLARTLTLVYIVWPRAFVIHVGDSRCYLLRSNGLKQLTRDHTVAQLQSENMIIQTDRSGFELAETKPNPITVVVTRFLKEMSTETLIDERATASPSEVDTGEFKIQSIDKSDEAEIAVATFATAADDRSQL